MDLFLWNVRNFRCVDFTENSILYGFVVVLEEYWENFLVFFVPSHVFHEEISWAHVLRAFESNILEVADCFITMSLEDHSTLNEQDDVIEEIPNISVRRVDAHDNSFIMFFSEFFECADHNECSE